MSTNNPILEARTVSIIVNRTDKPGQIARTEWRTGVAYGCPANPGDIVGIGASGKIDPCLLPSTSGVIIEVGGVPVVDQSILNFIPSTGISITSGATGQIIISATSATTKVTAIITFFNPDWPEDTTASVTVIGQTWVTADSVIIAGFGGITPDHGPDDAMVEDMSAYVENIIPGVGFDITAHAPLGTWGRYEVYALGVA